MKFKLRSIFYIVTLLSLIVYKPVNAQSSLQELATAFPEMPRGTADMLPFVSGFPTFASGAPFNDIQFTILDTDYMDGENAGFDTFLPVDTAEPFPGSDHVKYIRCATNTDLDLAYGAARGDRIILGTAEIDVPFFRRGSDGLDNDYAVIQHLDYVHGAIQLGGEAADYALVYYTLADGVATEGWYLFYMNDPVEPDLIAFIFPCSEIEPPISGNPPNNRALGQRPLLFYLRN